MSKPTKGIQENNAQTEVASTLELAGNNESVADSIDTTANPLKKYNMLYVILIILGAGFGLIQGNPIAAIGLAGFGFLITWFIVRIDTAAKLTKFRFTSYSLSANVPEDEIIEYLNRNFSCPVMELQKQLSYIAFLYKKETLLTIHFNKEKKTFNISSKMTLGQKLKNGGKANSAKLYVNTLQATPFLVKVIKDAINHIASNKN